MVLGLTVVGSAGVCIAHETGYRSGGALSKALSCLSSFVFLSSHHGTQQRRSCCHCLASEFGACASLLPLPFPSLPVTSRHLPCFISNLLA